MSTFTNKRGHVTTIEQMPDPRLELGDYGPCPLRGTPEEWQTEQDPPSGGAWGCVGDARKVAPGWARMDAIVHQEPGQPAPRYTQRKQRFGAKVF